MGSITSFLYSDQDFFSSGKLQPNAGSKRTSEDALRVLVVDDDMRIADTTVEVLLTAGFDARAAYTGESALQIAANFRPDCLLSDVVMSGMNGVDLAMAFRKLLPESRVVLMTGQAGMSDVLDDAERDGLTFELLSKPIRPRMLIEHLRKRPER